MILFDKARRREDIGVVNRVHDLLQRHPVSDQTRLVNGNMKLANLTPRDRDRCE